MSFIIRQLSRTADGREIVRATTAEADSIGIGRATDNEVHLADLAVEPRHATLRRVAAGRVEIVAISGLGFALDGREVMRAEVDPAIGAELRFGSHRVRLGEEAGRVTLSVERIEALSDASEAKDQQTVFTLRGLLPGKRLSAYGFVALVLAAFLAWPVWTWATYREAKIRPAGFHADAAWSSGKLSEAHASLGNDCQACHVDAFVSVRDQACTACHNGTQAAGEAALRPAALTGPARPGPAAYTHAPADRLAASRAPAGLGGRIEGAFKRAFNHPDGRCVDCHTEHEGAGRMPATAQAFCTDCHAGLQDRLGKAGFASSVGDAGDFGTAHPQLRPLVLAGYDAQAGRWQMRRASLDRPLRQPGGLKFTHAQHLSPSNAVAQMWRRVSPGQGGAMDCADCHRTDASGTRYQPVDMERDCQGCHSLGIETVGGTVRQLPHGKPEQVIADIRAYYGAGGGFRPATPPIARYARERPGEAAYERRLAQFQRAVPGRADAMVRATFAPRGVCGECHTVGFGGRAGVTIAPVAQPTRYLQKGWFDHRPHAKLAVRDGKGARTFGCVDCHAADKSNDADALLLPALSNCQSCHVGEAGDTKARLIRTGTPSGCAMCHDYHADGGAPWVDRRKRPRSTQLALREITWR